jgi:hypothetical protein
MQFKDVKVGELFTEGQHTETLIKTSTTISAVYNKRHCTVLIDKGRRIEYEFPTDHNVLVFVE